MAKTQANYSILVDCKLEAQQVQKQLDEIQKKLKQIEIKVDTKSLDGVAKKTEEATKKAEDMTLTWQQSAEIMGKALDTIESMVEQVYNLNAATIEFQKVSDLTGDNLDDYVSSLAEMGSEVARTGKPLCLSRNVQMVNVH